MNSPLPPPIQKPKRPADLLDTPRLELLVRENLLTIRAGYTRMIGELCPGRAIILVAGFPLAYILATGIAGKDGNLLSQTVATRSWNPDLQVFEWQVAPGLAPELTQFLETAWSQIYPG